MKKVIVQNILDSMSIGLIVVDAKGEIIATNPAASSILGYEQKEIRSKRWAELFLETRENEAFNQILVDVVMGERTGMHQEVPYLTPAGQRLQLSITSSFLHDRQQIVGLVMLIDDITELYRLHQEEKRALEERHRLQHERAVSLNHFAMSVAHQIRNPLMSLGGFLNRIFKNIDQQEPYAAYIVPIMNGMKRLEAIVTAVEEYTSISHPEKTPVLLGEIVDQVRLDLDMKAAALNKRIAWSIQLSANDVSLDYSLFAKALTELLVNALESFTSEEGHIEIVTEREGQDLMIEIRDSGAGIKEEYQPFIFDPFFTTKATGVGMGLSKVKRIIAEQNGKIQVQSSQGSGTKVNISLPIGP
ncbi:MAG: PAS domain S-box protein [Deltaproteobacteria bacterium]|nr:PAS domain S-box protein [Deltaproteobacteria bacterium]